MKTSFYIFIILAFSSFCSADPLPDASHIYVQGFSSIKVEPNLMTISVTIESINKDLEVAKQDVDNRSNILISSCYDFKIDRKDISASTLAIGPAYEIRNDNREFIGTQVNRGIEITLRDLNNYASLIKAIIDAKVTKIRSTVMSIDNEDEVIKKAQNEAMKDAVHRAEAIAQTAGKRVGDVYSISEFDLRRDERYFLFPNRRISQLVEVKRSSLYETAFEEEPFEPGLIEAAVEIYVVFYLID